MTTQELVERLRSYQAYCPQTDRSDHPICTEAADRLSEMDAENKKLREACLQAALTFRFYEQSHLAKKTQDGDEKAYRNHEMAAMCEAALEQQHQQKGEGL